MSDRYQRLRSSVDALADRDGYETARDVRALLSERDELEIALRAMLDRFDFGETFPSDHPIVFARAALARTEGRQGGE